MKAKFLSSINFLEKIKNYRENAVITVLFSSPVLAINGTVMSVFPKKTGIT